MLARHGFLLQHLLRMVRSTSFFPTSKVAVQPTVRLKGTGHMKPKNLARTLVWGVRVEVCAWLCRIASTSNLGRIVAALITTSVILIAGTSVPRVIAARAEIQAGGRLSLSQVLQSVRSGDSEETIIARIKRNGMPFNFSNEEKDE